MDGVLLALLISTGMALLLLAESIHSLAGGVRFVRRFRAAHGRPQPDFAPPLTLIVPCRELDPGLELNLRAFFEQDYPDLQILLVTGDRSDQSTPIMERVTRTYPGVAARILFAGRAERRGQKVHNLLHALRHLRRDDRIVAFGDSDVRPSTSWLRHLAAGLADRGVGVVTGFRWYVPEAGGFASALRSIWNASVASMFNADTAPFAWGGAMAVRRSTFEACRVAAYWDGALSDDYVLSEVMQTHDLAIRFEPRCLSFSYGDCGLRELVAWSFRQLAITRVCRPGLWRLAMLSELFSHLSFWGGGVVVTVAVLTPPVTPWLTWVLLLLLTATHGVRGGKGWLRLAALRQLFPQEHGRLRRWWWGYLSWGPLVGFLTLAGLVRSAVNREIEWRGIRYRMVSCTETVVLGPVHRGRDGGRTG